MTQNLFSLTILANRAEGRKGKGKGGRGKGERVRIFIKFVCDEIIISVYLGNKSIA
jgi:hypothetical protein